MRKIKIDSKKHGHFELLVDNSDFRSLIKHSWGVYVRKSDGKLSVRAAIKKDGVYKVMHISRVIMAEVPKGMVVDHINGNRLDNRRSNLRICTPSQNNYNRRISSNNSTGFKGVQIHWCGKDRTVLRYRARIHVGYKSICLKTFGTPREAAIAYNKAATEYYGEFAKLNIIP